MLVKVKEDQRKKTGKEVESRGNKNIRRRNERERESYSVPRKALKHSNFHILINK